MVNEIAQPLDQPSIPATVPNALADVYHAFQSIIAVDPAPTDSSLRNLVTFDDAKVEPIHRWYSFKEGYSHRLLSWLLAQDILPSYKGIRLLYPYCGAGTSLLASQSHPCDEHIALAVGIERNPAIQFIAQAKLNWSQYSIGQIETLLERLLSDTGRCSQTFSVPSLSTFSATRRSGKRAFEPTALQDLLYYRDWIKRICGGIAEYSFFMLAWTSTIEKASNTRKDGRALRLVATPTKLDVKELLLAQCKVMLDDLYEVCDLPGPKRTCHIRRTHVMKGDARALQFADNFFTAICYSPPYLNNIDYTEVYKLELWLRGDVTSQEEFKALRLSTFRSHPSVLFPSTTVCDALGSNTWIARLKSALLSALPDDCFKQMRRSLFSGYIDDLILSLREQYRVAAPGTPIVCVVGNSLHGGQQRIPVCTDLLIAASAQAVGLVVDRLQIARQLPRRDHQNGWLRETIILMHKPDILSGGR